MIVQQSIALGALSSSVPMHEDLKAKLPHATFKSPTLFRDHWLECRRRTWNELRPSPCFLILRLPLPPIPANPTWILAGVIGRFPQAGWGGPETVGGGHETG